METKNTLLNKFIRIQEMQLELDKKKKQFKEIGKEVRSMSQKIPQLLRELDLK